MTTLTDLKANHKDKWAVVKAKSASKLIKVLPAQQLEKMQGELTEKQSLLEKMNERKRTELLSPQDQSKYDELVREIKEIESTLEWTKFSAQELLKSQSNLRYLEEEKKDLKNNLIRANTKLDQLNDKLNWLRTLVRAGDISKLQELVRSAKI